MVWATFNVAFADKAPSISAVCATFMVWATFNVALADKAPSISAV